MMRKMLTLVLVLSMASLASAGVVDMDVYVNDVLVPGSIGDAVNGDIVKVVITDTAPPTGAGKGFAEFTVSVSQMGTYNAASDGWADGPLSPTVPPWDPIVTPSVLVTVVGTGFDAASNAVYYGTAPLGPPNAGDIHWWTFTVNGDPSGTNSILIDPDYGSYVGNFAASGEQDAFGTVTLVPEPMTIALLGLGGLFLRRRK